ncbi:MAG: NGG1p interacting factor NIF3 [Candidatus Omnitrophica bacterium]|nr:NGG1p interacting factor NIF3 [Candidatus Omnitrophota bacterium]
MNLGAIYEGIIEEGIKSELRTRAQVESQLASVKKQYKKLQKREQKFFDKESFKNPYADTRILHGDPNKEIRRVLVGVDIGVAELLVADQLAQRGKPVDLVMSHHPQGIALAGLADVMRVQTDLLENLGIENSIAKGLMDKRITEVTRRLHSGNHTRVVDVARLLDIPLMCCHTPADNHVAKYLQKMMDTQKPKTLQKVEDLLMKEPEYKAAAKEKIGPCILVGKPKDKAGKVVVDMTGGTSGSQDIFGRLSQLGVGTMLCMHIGEKHLQKVRNEYIKVVNAGHMASDNLGMNLLLDKLNRKGKFEVVVCSGFRRFKRS